MKQMTLWKSSQVIRNKRIISDSVQAERILGEDTRQVDWALVKVYDDKGAHIIWADRENKGENGLFCSVFNEQIDISEVRKARVLRDEEVFFFFNELFYSHKDCKGLISIRRINTISSENILEQFLQYDETFKFEYSIELISLYSLKKQKKYVATTWVVYLKDRRVLSYIPLFSQDKEVLDKENLFGLAPKKLDAGDTFSRGEKTYCVLRDRSNKLAISEVDASDVESR